MLPNKSNDFITIFLVSVLTEPSLATASIFIALLPLPEIAIVVLYPLFSAFRYSGKAFFISGLD